MIAIEVRVNGKLEATCGVENFRELIAFAAAYGPRNGKPARYVVESMGVRPINESTEEVLRWLNSEIAMGDEVSLRLVEVAESTVPFDKSEIPTHPPR